MSKLFDVSEGVEAAEEADVFAPRFDSDWLLPVIVSDAGSSEILMHGCMNAEALERTLCNILFWLLSLLPVCDSLIILFQNHIIRNKGASYFRIVRLVPTTFFPMGERYEVCPR